MMRRPLSRRVVWVMSLAALVVATLLMLAVRSTLDKAHVALAYLIIVLAGSSAGGRTLGFTLASVAFLAFNVFFLPPYGTFAIANPLDWLVLLAFLVTSLIGAQLLTRAQDEAADARARAAEVERLSILGSETLNVGRAEDALDAITEVIRSTLGIDECQIVVQPKHQTESSLIAWVHAHGVAAAERMDGTLHVPAVRRATEEHDVQPVVWSEFEGVRVLTVPLRVRDRTVGVLQMVNAAGIQLVPQQQRFLDVLTYYAALGVERVRLAAEAEYVETMRETDRLKNALLAAVSHDLRTPLTTIKALAHDIADHGATAGDVRVRSIEEEADHLTGFVADLLDLSRLTGGALRMNPALNTAEDLIGAAVDRVSGVLGQHPLRVLHEPEAPILVGYFDFVHALRALVNLIENAAKYSPAEHPIELSVQHEGAMLVFTVADRGPGVPEAERKKIFEPFYRPPNVPSDVRGAGLGLAIAQGLASAQGGWIRYEPRDGGGSLFHLALPVAAPAAPLVAGTP